MDKRPHAITTDMKYNRTFWALSLTLLFLFCIPAPKANAQYDNPVTYDDFYQNLAPYGQWIEDPQYGYVWSPNVEGDFRPYYTSGHWVMTEYGNTWVSDYIWGWACFHYGRWTFDNYYGWLWIPGTTWGPAWVSWRYGQGYYGWAPLGPGYQFGPSYAEYTCPNDWWIFIPPQYVYTGNYYHYWNGPRGNSRIIGTTTVINNTYVNNNVTYVSGPHAAQVQQVTGQPVQVFHVRSSNNMNTRVHNNEVRMYRPSEVRPTAPNGTERPVPPNVVAAPQPVRSAQPVNTSQSPTPPFRNAIPDNTHTVTPGTNFNETAQPTQPRRHNETKPYEWDVNRSVPQEEPAQQPRNQPQPQPVRQNPQQPQPQRQNPQPQQPQPPQPQPVRQNPQPQRQNPQPAPARPAPAQQTQQGGRR